MITAVDTSVLLDVLKPDPVFGRASAQALRAVILQGSLVACEVVWAEVGACFTTQAAADDALGRLTVGFSSLDAAAALEAGAVWRIYRARGGVRERVIAEFLIGAHARTRADRLLTRDRGFFSSYFRDLDLLHPSAG